MENLVCKMIHPTHKVQPSAPILISDYHSVSPIENMLDPFDSNNSLNNMGPTKPKQNSFNYNTYMKCFIHELRTPITTITLGLDLLKHNIVDKETRQTINDINKSAIFIENILTKFAKIKNGNIELNAFEPFSLKKLITGVEILILYNFKDSGVSFTYVIDPNVSLWNYGDVHNIKHVIINLLKNSIKYRDIDRENTISIHILLDLDADVRRTVEKGTVGDDSEARKVEASDPIDADSKNQTLCIYIRDVNNRILPHIKENLFNSFNSTSGSGMGLYICKNIIELHGGNITHNFIEPCGNEFVIKLNLTICSDPSLYVETPVSIFVLNEKIDNSGNEASESTYDILIVDDSILNLKMMSTIMKTFPIFNHIYTAENGTDAVNKIKQYIDKINVVLLDKNMPIMNGWESVKSMRTLSYNKLVFGLTGEDSSDEVQGFLENGADYVIIKPFDTKKIKLLCTFLKTNGIERQPNKTIQLVNDQLEWV
jgi:CheY-like chemotaxis protein/nitrogen-specific signal transduction histidine kinase